MSGEAGGNNDDQTGIRSADELRTPDTLQMGRLFYHFRPTPGASMGQERVVVPQLDWEGVRNEMERLSIENQRLKDIIISMHLNSPATVSYRGYQGHASSSRNDQNLERIMGIGSLASVSSGQPQGPNVLHNGGVADDSISISSSLPSDQTATEGFESATMPADSKSEKSLDYAEPETPSDISYNDTSENDDILDESYESSSGCSTIRIIEVEDDSSDSEPAEVEDEEVGVNTNSDHESDIHIADVSGSESEFGYESRLGSSNNSLDAEATVGVEQEHGASDFWVNQRDNARSSGRINYDVPDDFDPEQDDVLSDVETVQSDEALTAWGIERDISSEETRLVPDEKEIKHETTCSDEEEDGWEEVPREINSTLNLRLCNSQTLTSPACSGNILRAIENTKTEPREPGQDVTPTAHGSHVSANTIKSPINSKVHAVTRTKEKANPHETLVDRLEGKDGGIDEGDEIFQDKKHIPQTSAAILDFQLLEDVAYVARRKDPTISSTSHIGPESSIFPRSRLFSNPLTPPSFDAYDNNMTPLIPVTLTRPVGHMVRSQKSIEWMHPKQTGMSDSARIQPPGEKNTLEASDITKNQVKTTNEPRDDGRPIRISRVKETQSQTSGGNQLGTVSSSKMEHTIYDIPRTEPKVDLGTRSQETLAKNAQTLATKKHSPIIPPIVNFSAVVKQPIVIKPSQNMPTRIPKASHRAPSPGSRRNRGPGPTHASPKVVSSKEPSRSEEPELHHKKSIRFCDVLTPNTAKPESQDAKVDTNKPLVSILKPTPVELPTHLSENNRIYNYEYIREVVVRNLPKDVTLSSLLNRVRGGLLEKALIDSHDLSARLVFVEPEAARRYYNHIQRAGFLVQTEVPAAESSMKERLVQCNLRGFTWTNHSCEIPVHMIQNIWKHGATRCLVISNFPKDIGVMRFVEDVLKLLSLPAIEAKNVIEGASTDRDLLTNNVSIRVGFSCIQYAFKVHKDLSTFVPLYSSVLVLYDKDPCGGLINNEPPSCWTGGKEIGNDRLVVPSTAAIRPQAPAKKSASLPFTAVPRKPTTNVRADIVALWNQFDDKSQPAAIEKGPVNPPVIASAPPVADISIAFKGFPLPRKRTRKSPGESNPNISTHAKPIVQKARIEKNVMDSTSPAIIGQTIYDNWGVGVSLKAPQPPLGAHWNYGEQKTVREYNEAITKKIRRMPEILSIPNEKPKIENLRPDHPLIDRVVYLKNLPRNFHVARLFRFIRGGMVEHVELMPPNSEYNTSSAIIVFVDRNSVKSYKSYLKSPGLTVEKNQRVVSVENITPDIVANIRSLSHNDSRTRCLHIESLPRDTMLGEFLGIIEESMNHSNLEFEHATVRESNGCSEAFLRLLTIGTAAFVARVLERSYTGITITYDRDPCEGPVEELDEVNLELR